MKQKKVFGILAISLVAVFFAYDKISPRNDSPPPTQPPHVSQQTVPTFHSGKINAEDEHIGSAPHTDTKDKVAVQSPQLTFKKSSLAQVKTVIIDEKEYPLRTYSTLATPNDPLGDQWWVSNTKLTNAWDIPRGTHETTLAVIDTGFALQHEEFTDRWHTNQAESGVATVEMPSLLNCTDRGLPIDASCNLIDDNRDGIVDNEVGPLSYENNSQLNCTDQGKPLTKDCNRVDEDDNGFIDDIRGWDFINNDRSVQAGELNPTGSGTTHGTLVTGIAAATGNNSKGIAGVDWATKILPIQALDDDSYGDTLSVGQAIYYAVSQNVDVISISLGSSLPDDFVLQAVKAASDAGIMVVAASGNDGCDCIVYPANYPEVLAVGALNESSVPASFSSWGNNLDMLAPGTNLTSPTWTAANQNSAYASGINGTSFSTPMVGGMLTRLLSLQPSATTQQLMASLKENTNRLSLSSTTTRSTTLGHGTLDAHRSSLRMTNPLSSQQIYTLSPIQKGNYLSPDGPQDETTPGTVHLCGFGAFGATPIYELKKSSAHFFTVNYNEMQEAITQGYTSSLFAYGCVLQPHDQPTVVRNLNVFREFRNIDGPR
ncbi:MAG TPA: S8 family serine peptidase [Candidatus Nitrosotenuis sp.]|nr:S8 family serine peptidase [Candidatus Nitrosotenuis sp.]